MFLNILVLYLEAVWVVAYIALIIHNHLVSVAKNVFVSCEFNYEDLLDLGFSVKDVLRSSIQFYFILAINDASFPFN